ncbi:MAG: hypothetical protein AB7Q17_00430 [Phycisphaerae bacterium]
MRKPRMFAAVSGGLAATIALAAFFVVPSASTPSMAATIFNSLREAVHRGIAVEFERVCVEGVQVDGRAEIVFPAEISLRRMVEQGAELPEPECVAIDLTVRADNSNEELAGLDVHVAGAFSAHSQWAFVRLAGLPDEVLRETPEAAIVVPFLRRGLLLDLTGVEELAGVRDWFHDADDRAAAVSARVGASTSGGPAASVTEHAAAGAAGSISASAQQQMKVGVGISPGAADLSVHIGDDGANEPGGLRLDGQSPALEAAVMDLLTGRAGADRIGEFVTQIEQLAGKVSTKQIEPGMWILEAAEFKTEGMDAEELELLRGAKLSLRYVEGTGIESAELSHFGARDGRLRFSFVDAADPALAGMQRFEAEGFAALKVGDVMKMLGGLTGGDAGAPDRD